MNICQYFWVLCNLLISINNRNGPEDRNRDNNDHNEDNHGEYGEDRPTGMDPDGVIEVWITPDLHMV